MTIMNEHNADRSDVLPDAIKPPPMVAATWLESRSEFLQSRASPLRFERLSGEISQLGRLLVTARWLAAEVGP